MEPQNLLVILAFPFAKPACFATGNSPGGALRNHLFRPVRILGDGPLKQWSKCSPGGITSVMPVTVPITSVMPVTVPSNSGASVLQGATVTDRPSCFWPALEQVVYRGARPGDQDGLLTGRTPQRGPLEGATTGEPILAAPTWPPTVVEQVVYRGPRPGDQDGLLTGRTPQRGPLEGATTGEPILAAPTWPPHCGGASGLQGARPTCHLKGCAWAPLQNWDRSSVRSKE